MKRQFTAILILLMTLGLTACGHGGQDTEGYLDILKADTYTLAGEGTYEGVFYTVVQHVNGEDFHIRYRNANDSTFRFIGNDGVLYRIMDNLHYYAVAEESALPHIIISNIMDYDYNSAEYSKSKNTTIHGIKYNYDVYTLDKKDGEKATLHIYTTPDDGGIYALAFPEASIIISINQLYPGLPDTDPLTGLEIFFEIPENFREVEYQQLDSYPEI